MASSISPAHDSYRSNADASNNGGESEAVLSQLVSEASKTVGTLKNIVSNSYRKLQEDSTTTNGESEASSGGFLNDFIGSSNEKPGPIGKFFNGRCFKTCGMEDIQLASRNAAQMFSTMNVCLIVLTIMTAICLFAITVAVVVYIYKNRHALQRYDPSIHHQYEPMMPVKPLVFSKLDASSILSNNNTPPHSLSSRHLLNAEMIDGNGSFKFN